jgi:hypothetical protein
MNPTPFLLSAAILASISISGLPGPLGEGVAQRYPHCHAIPEILRIAAPEEIRGTIQALTTQRPCLAQATYLVARVDVDGPMMNVYVAPAEYLETRGVELSEGDDLHAWVVPAGAATTALSLEINGAQVLLRDELGHPIWETGAVTH